MTSSHTTTTRAAPAARATAALPWHHLPAGRHAR